MELCCAEGPMMIIPIPRQPVFCSLMVTGLFVIISSIQDRIMSRGSDLMELWCWLEVVVVRLQLRFSLRMEDHRGALIWSIRASEILYSLDTIEHICHLSFSYSCLIDEGDTFLITGGSSPTIGTVSCTTLMVGLKTLIHLLMDEVIMDVLAIPTTLVLRWWKLNVQL